MSALSPRVLLHSKSRFEIYYRVTVVVRNTHIFRDDTRAMTQSMTRVQAKARFGVPDKLKRATCDMNRRSRSPRQLRLGKSVAFAVQRSRSVTVRARGRECGGGILDGPVRAEKSPGGRPRDKRERRERY